MAKCSLMDATTAFAVMVRDVKPVESSPAAMGLPYRTFYGLKKRFWCLLGCSASKGPQRELLWHLLGYNDMR